MIETAPHEARRLAAQRAESALRQFEQETPADILAHFGVRLTEKPGPGSPDAQDAKDARA